LKHSFKQIADIEKKIVAECHHQWERNACKYSFFCVRHK